MYIIYYRKEVIELEFISSSNVQDVRFSYLSNIDLNLILNQIDLISAGLGWENSK